MDNDDILDSEDMFDLEEGHRVDLMSVQKFIILSIGAFGLYPIWWCYKTWKFFKEEENLNINAAARAIFAIFLPINYLKKY